MSLINYCSRRTNVSRTYIDHVYIRCSVSISIEYESRITNNRMTAPCVVPRRGEGYRLTPPTKFELYVLSDTYSSDHNPVKLAFSDFSRYNNHLPRSFCTK